MVKLSSAPPGRSSWAHEEVSPPLKKIRSHRPPAKRHRGATTKDNSASPSFSPESRAGRVLPVLADLRGVPHPEVPHHLPPLCREVHGEAAVPAAVSAARGVVVLGHQHGQGWKLEEKPVRALFAPIPSTPPPFQAAGHLTAVTLLLSGPSPRAARGGFCWEEKVCLGRVSWGRGAGSEGPVLGLTDVSWFTGFWSRCAR